VIFDLQGVNFIDSQGASKLGEISENLRASGLSFRLARVKPRVMEVLESDGLVQRIGPASFHLDVNEAVEAGMTHVQQAPADPLAAERQVAVDAVALARRS
jgi:hypothetical protein